ncbi:PaTRK-1 low-affinity potassium transport encoded by the Patrk-1 protein [Triangularia setosa]|uniref:Potassium transport protein n=1 Tax=Triangularia setosa TaxID=2587417 RepID=A0AAN6WDT4_9PEZI|nr:PaTRK-1 low-affinity potassium transport encoded by the Patrk-1 protein [Podospora setosa]
MERLRRRFKGLALDDVKRFLYSRPAWLSNVIFPRDQGFPFIRYHYYLIIFLALLGSVIVYGAGLYSGGTAKIAYIDALFFCAGASTQAGLNTIDINKLSTFQQAIFYLWPMMANPITVNTLVVHLRLYWFEKKFQRMTQNARHNRVTLSKSFTKSRTKAKQQDGDVEKGVNGRKITVMLNGKKSRINNDGTLLGDVKNKGRHGLGLTATSRTATDGALDGSLDRPDQHAGPAVTSSMTEPRKPALKFAHTVTKSDGLGEDYLKLPRMRSDEEHIAIVERQKKGDDEVLRIPNPRDVERGLGPKRVEAGDNDDSELLSPRAEAFNLDGESRAPAADGRHPAITIEEPDRRQLQETDSDEFMDDVRAAAHTFDFLKPHFPRNKKKPLDTEKEAAHAGPSQNKRRQSMQTLRTAFSHNKVEGTPYLSWEPTVGRNSLFPELTEEQREELGGIEYRSLKTLARVLTFYFWGYTALGVTGLLPWILKMNDWGKVVEDVGQSRVWWAFFTAQSAFMDLGFTLTPDSMNSFSTATWPLLWMSFLIVIGNTGFPIMLRFMIWVLSLVVPKDSGMYEELRFLLDHPRRCFTLLFPSKPTWWLLAFLVLLNGLDVMFFIVLDLGQENPVTLMTDGQKVLNGIFEAASTRTAGFSCVNLALLHPAVQVSYMIMMYISVFPIAISVRRTNVYEENALGIYSKHNEDEDNSKGSNEWSHVGTHARRQLSFDLPVIAMGIFILAISEGPRIMNPTDADNGFTMFAMLFEVISAYGTVGMSLGYATISASLSAEFSTVGKLVIIALMIRGRHRGLPYKLDRAILLPSEALNAKDAMAADTEGRLARQYSRMSVATHRSDTTHNQSRVGNILAAILHPGPPMPPEPPMEVIHRRSTDPGSDAEPHHAMRVTSRRTEPGVVRRSVSHLFSPRPRTAGGHEDD